MGYTPWLYPILLLCDFNGMLDAILRYPVVHELDSFFCIKQLLLVGLKTLAHAIMWRNVSRTVVWFLGLLCLCCWFLPLAYLMALPIGDTQSQIGSASDVRDKDIIIKVVLIIGSIINQGDPAYSEGQDMRDEGWEYIRTTTTWGIHFVAENLGMGKVLVKVGAVDKRNVTTRRQ